MADVHGNIVAREGVDKCACGVKYWEKDRCVSCGAPVTLDFFGLVNDEVRDHFQLVVVR